MNILQSIQQLDGEILLLIQRYLRTDMLTPFMKSVTFLGNGGWFWILCAVVLLAVPKTRKTGYAAALSLIFGAIVTNLLLKNIVARPRPFAEIRSSHPYDHQTEGFLFSVRSHHSILCRCSGNAPDASEEIRNPGSSPGSTGGIFQTVSWCPLSDRCSDRIRDRAGGKHVVSMDRANETGRQTGTLALSIGNMKHFIWTKY